MTSNEKFQPGEETFEDVQAHAFRVNGEAEPSSEGDVEGHRVARVESNETDEDDTDGHGFYGRL